MPGGTCQDEGQRFAGVKSNILQVPLICLSVSTYEVSNIMERHANNTNFPLSFIPSFSSENSTDLDFPHFIPATFKHPK